MVTAFKTLAELCEKFGDTRKRLLMIDLAADFLLRLETDEVEPAISMILGRPFPKCEPKNLEVSWSTLSQAIMALTSADWSAFNEAFGRTGDIGAATQAMFEKNMTRRQAVLFTSDLTIMEVRRSFERLAEASGSGSRVKKERLIKTLLSAASPLEAKYLVKIFVGEMRTGFHEGLMEQAVAKAFQIPPATVQRGSMVMGDVGMVASLVRVEGVEALGNISFQVFRPVSLMLAQMANDVAEVLKEHGGKSAFEYKYDGARVQIHKLKDNVKVFSRRLTDVTESLPETVQKVRHDVRAEQVILEGEVIAVDKQGFPIPFQHLMRRFKRVHSIENVASEIPTELFLFDVLFLNGESLISNPYKQRRKILSEVAGDIPLAKQIMTDNAKEAEVFLNESMNAGHEGLMAKKPDSLYTPGIRGRRWLKIKPVLELLDLVIVAAEYGYGRRHDWLSDYYLAARDEKTGEFLSIGKTFKGLTDEEIIEMTGRLKGLTLKEERRKVVVVPKIVVEVAYNEVQKSPKYKSAMALRFARITRIRDDKTPDEADTIQRVREIYERQFLKKGRYKTE